MLASSSSCFSLFVIIDSHFRILRRLRRLFFLRAGTKEIHEFHFPSRFLLLVVVPVLSFLDGSLEERRRRRLFHGKDSPVSFFF